LQFFLGNSFEGNNAEPEPSGFSVSGYVQVAMVATLTMPQLIVSIQGLLTASEFLIQ